MTRRWALAAALFLTATFGFVVVSYGSSAGVFAWADRSTGATQPLSGDGAATLTPGIVTDLVVLDPTADAQGAPSRSEDAGEREGDHGTSAHDGASEHEDEHDD